MILNHLQHTGATETLERLGVLGLLTLLGEIERIADLPNHVSGERQEVLLGAADPSKRF